MVKAKLSNQKQNNHPKTNNNKRKKNKNKKRRKNKNKNRIKDQKAKSNRKNQKLSSKNTHSEFRMSLNSHRIIIIACWIQYFRSY